VNVLCVKEEKKRRGRDEEKKDGALKRGMIRSDPMTGLAAAHKVSIEEYVASVDSVDDLGARHFESLDELHDALVQLELSDSKYKLDDNGFVMMPGKRHNSGVTLHLNEELRIWKSG
jgi:hypothetical protein